MSKTHREQQPLRKGAHFVLGYRNADSTAKGQHPAVCGAVPEQHELRLGAGRGVRSISGSLGPAPGTSFWFTLIFFSHSFFAPARFLSGQHGLREPKGYTLLLRLGSRRQAARPFGLGQVEYAVERRALDAGGMRRLGPRLAEGSAGNRLLHCDRQHAPPATRPA